MKQLFIFCTLWYFSLSIAQSTTRWEDHFSYKEVSDIKENNGVLFCATENAIFSYDLTSKEVNKISKANVLKNVGVQAIAFSEENDMMIVAFDGGNLNLIQEGEALEVIDIPLDDYQGSKKINHLFIEGNNMIISADYGISVYDLERKEFAETTFFPTPVLESVLLNNEVYAATQNGIYTHANDDFIPNFNAWTHSFTSAATHMEVFDSQVVASSGGSLYAYNGSWQLQDSGASINKLTVNAGFLTVASDSQIKVFGAGFSLNNQQSFSLSNDNINVGLVSGGDIYLGLANNGMYSQATNENIYPDGPYTNNSYHVTAQNEWIWVSPGGENNYNQPLGNADGLSYFNTEKWIHIPTEDLNGARDIVDIGVNPNSINNFTATSWNESTTFFQIETEDDTYSVSEFPSSNVQGYARFGGAVYDEEGNVWVTQSFAGSSGADSQFLQINGNSLLSRVSFGSGAGGGGISAPTLYGDYLWAGGTRGDGVQMLDVESDNTYVLTTADGSGSLPSNNVHTVAIDNNGMAWIGTDDGLHVKSNAGAEVVRGNMTTSPIVVVQDGITEALLTDTDITSIAVDAANQKWIGTAGSGVFVVSSSGTETVYRFTENNSGLPSNEVYDIGIDAVSGKVYFATEKGLASYLSDVSSNNDDLSQVLAYPNPVRPGFTGNVVIKGLTSNAVVQILDVVGNLMYKGEAAGGIVQWDTTNLKGKKVASGVYLVMVISSDGIEKTTTKIAIIR